MDKITSFSGKYRFLSNFWPCEIKIDDLTYPSVEHAFQASKTTSSIEKIEIYDADTPGKAKRLGKKVTLREDWETVKVYIMGFLLDEKFKNPTLRKALLDTGSVELIEGNTWGDTFWGVCDGQGENTLGKLLMDLRDDIRMYEKAEEVR